MRKEEKSKENKSEEKRKRKRKRREIQRSSNIRSYRGDTNMGEREKTREERDIKGSDEIENGKRGVKGDFVNNQSPESPPPPFPRPPTPLENVMQPFYVLPMVLEAAHLATP